MINTQQLKDALGMVIDDEADDFEDINVEELGRIKKRFSTLIDQLAKEASEPEDD